MAYETCHFPILLLLLQVMLALREMGTPGVITPDALAKASGAFKLKHAQLAALEAEYALLQEAGLPTADSMAGLWPSTAAGIQKMAAKGASKRLSAVFSSKT
jgi:hypothetical protein